MCYIHSITATLTTKDPIMKNLFAAALIAFATLTANATVITFDDVPGAGQDSYGVVSNYKGFTFSRGYWIDTVGSSWNYGAKSGDFTMLNNMGGEIVVTKIGAADFSFDGLWAETWANQSSLQGTVYGLNNGVKLWSVNTTITNGFSFIAGQSAKIDELHINLGNFFLVDNLALNEASTTTTTKVPEPASLAMMGLGLAALAGMRRQRRQA